jgi:hypothetical protein
MTWKANLTRSLDNSTRNLAQGGPSARFISSLQASLENVLTIIFCASEGFLRDRAVSIVAVSKHGSKMRDRESPLLIAVHAQLTNS